MRTATKEQTVNALIKGGFNENDAKKMTSKYHAQVKRLYGCSTPKQMANHVSAMWAAQ